MPLFNAKFSSFDLNKGKATKTLDEAIQVQMRNMARIFAGVMLRLIPFRTGFARGTIKNIYEAVGGGSTEGEAGYQTRKIRKKAEDTPAARFLVLAAAFKYGQRGRGSLSASSLKKAAKTTKNIHGQLGVPVEYYYGSGGKVLKTVNSGRQFATGANEIITGSRGNYRFNFAVAITYFNLLEASTIKGHGPWKAFYTASSTAFNWLRTVGVQRLPTIVDFLGEYTLNVQGTTVTKERTIYIRGQGSSNRLD